MGDNALLKYLHHQEFFKIHRSTNPFQKNPNTPFDIFVEDAKMSSTHSKISFTRKWKHY